MSEVARGWGPEKAASEPSIEDLLEPVALEARLAEARARRSQVLAAKLGNPVLVAGASPPAAKAHVPELPAFLIGLAAGAAALGTFWIINPFAVAPTVASAPPAVAMMWPDVPFRPADLLSSAWLAIAALPTPTSPAVGSEMPSDAVLASFAPLRVPAMPAENLSRISIAFPDGDLVRSEFLPYLQQAPRIEVPAPEDTPRRLSEVAASPASPAAASTDAARPTLRFTNSFPERRHHLTVASLVDDPAPSEGVGYPLQSRPPRSTSASCEGE